MISAPLTQDRTATSTLAIDVREPSLDDAGALWQIAGDSRTLDLNPSYAYLLWCRDYAGTSVIATVGDDGPADDGAPADGSAGSDRSTGEDRRPAGFVTGYRRPDEPRTLMVWQVAVDEEYRGHGVAGAMLDGLVDRLDDIDWLETTITDDNVASIALFTSFAQRRGSVLSRSDLFQTKHFPDNHDAERLYRIGPLS